MDADYRGSQHPIARSPPPPADGRCDAPTYEAVTMRPSCAVVWCGMVLLLAGAVGYGVVVAQTPSGGHEQHHPAAPPAEPTPPPTPAPPETSPPPPSTVQPASA